MENMERLSPSVCEPLENVMVEVSASQLSEQEGISFEEAKEHVREMLPPGGTEIYCLSNESKLNGAVSIISENVQKMVAEQVGGDYYVLPSSVHELMIVPKSLGMNLGELEEMMKFYQIMYISTMQKNINSADVFRKETWKRTWNWI